MKTSGHVSLGCLLCRGYQEVDFKREIPSGWT